MEIKKREIIFSVTIVAFMLIIGFSISGKIRQSLIESYQKYDTAVKINDKEQFQYGMSTHIGNAFVYGDLKAIDYVNFQEVGGEYSYIKKEEQKYTRHSRTVTKTYRDSNGNTRTKTEIEYYWTWDTIRTEKKHSNKIAFLGVEFDYAKIPFPPAKQIKILKTGYHRRNVYYATGTEFQGTIFTTLKEDTIGETSFYNNQTIDETIEDLEKGYEIVIFWVVWLVLTVAVVIGFYYLENRWLD